MSELIKELSGENFDKEIADGVCLVDFWAAWCNPCRMLAPILERVAVELNGVAKICKVEVDSNEDLAMRFRISSIPNMIIFKDGKQVDSIVGVRDKDYIVQAVKKHLN